MKPLTIVSAVALLSIGYLLGSGQPLAQAQTNLIGTTPLIDDSGKGVVDECSKERDPTNCRFTSFRRKLAPDWHIGPIGLGRDNSDCATKADVLAALKEHDKFVADQPRIKGPGPDVTVQSGNSPPTSLDGNPFGVGESMKTIEKATKVETDYVKEDKAEQARKEQEKKEAEEKKKK